MEIPIEPCRYICSQCGGTDISEDANAVWKHDIQEFVFDSLQYHEQSWCSDCENQVKAIFVGSQIYDLINSDNLGDMEKLLDLIRESDNDNISHEDIFHLITNALYRIAANNDLDLKSVQDKIDVAMTIMSL